MHSLETGRPKQVIQNQLAHLDALKNIAAGIKDVSETIL